MRLFFATDVHSSEKCWRKFLAAAEFYEADVLVLGGDMTGKAIVPIVETGGGRYILRLQGQEHALGDDELPTWKREIRDRGLYPLVTTADEVSELQADPSRTEAAMRELVVTTVAEWAELAEERLGRLGMRCFVCPGNDDLFEIDDIISASPTLELCEGRAVDIGDGYQMVSTGWSNNTPWDTHREEPEHALAGRIASAIGAASVEPERQVFNFHCPPHGTLLDEAPELGEDLSVSSGGRILAHVGSTAVRAAIERERPALSLHGHIHEARGVERLGPTLSINPGSSYEMGTLQGVLVELNGKKKVKGYRLTSG
jgi:Icc-related predicted phosphoesterase